MGFPHDSRSGRPNVSLQPSEIQHFVRWAGPLLGTHLVLPAFLTQFPHTYSLSSSSTAGEHGGGGREGPTEGEESASWIFVLPAAARLPTSAASI